MKGWKGEKRKGKRGGSENNFMHFTWGAKAQNAERVEVKMKGVLVGAINSW